MKAYERNKKEDPQFYNDLPLDKVDRAEKYFGKQVEIIWSVALLRWIVNAFVFFEYAKNVSNGHGFLDKMSKKIR